MRQPSVLPPPAREADLAARFVVRSAVMAPSIHNTQPWRFVGRAGGLELWADRSRRLRVADPAGRELVISCAAALFNARLAIRHLGFAPGVRLLPDPANPDLLARLSWGSKLPPRPYEELLYWTAPRRHTHRGPFGVTPVPPTLLSTLTGIARHEGTELHLVQDGPQRLLLAEQVQAAETAQRRDPRFVDELLRWTAPPGARRPDGLAAGTYPIQPDGMGFASRDFAAGLSWGFRPRADDHPDPRVLGTVAVLTTRRDDRLAWLVAGQALQHVLLHATAVGVSVAFHTQPLELPAPRDAIRSDLTGAHPQAILRLGHTSRVLHSPRRPVIDVLQPATPQR